MAHAHAGPDAILVAFLEKGNLTEIAHRVNMTLASLASWAAKHADLLTNLHQLLTTRAKLLAASVELSALDALAAISSSTTSTDDPKLRERALERQRKAAGAILRHRTWLQRVSCLAPSPRAAGRTVIDGVDDDEGRSASAPNAPSSLDASMPLAPMPASSHQPLSQRKPSLAERLASRRLATLQHVT